MCCNLTWSKSLFQIYIHKIWGGSFFYRAGHFSITEILWKSDPGVIILYRIVTRGSLYPRVNILYNTGNGIHMLVYRRFGCIQNVKTATIQLDLSPKRCVDLYSKVRHAKTATRQNIALSRDPSTRHLDGQFQIWTGEIFRGRATTCHSVIRPRPGSLYDGCHHWNITCSVSPRNKYFQYCEFLARRSKMPTTTLFTCTLQA